MTFLLALKNTRLSLMKRLPLAVFLAGTLGLLFLGNTVFSGTDSGMARTFRTSLTADYSLSAVSEDPFNLFGSELPLLGEYFKMPVILDYESVAAAARAAVPGAEWQPLVVGQAKLSLKTFSAGVALFSADLPEYFHFFPSLELVRGTLPTAGEPAILMNERLFLRMAKSLGREPAIGEKILLTAAQDGSFALRDAPLAGVFRYPVYDPVLENVCLLDVGTGRALAGYYITAAAPAAESSVAGSVDDLFAGASDTRAPTDEGISFESVTREVETSGTAPVEDPHTWNFLLIRPPRGVAAEAALQTALRTASSPVEVRDWRDTAGGNAKTVSFLQLLFNVGLVFVSLVAGMIVMNSMSLAVAERTREIGTMRSLGAGRGWVAQLISFETIILVTGSGLVGVAVGASLLYVTTILGGVEVTNPYLSSLLGTTTYRPQVSGALMVEHVVLSLVLGALATILPARKALSVTPLQAMARE